MQTLTINSREHGPQHFRAPEDGGYVWHWTGNDPSKAKQPCEGGSFRGPTVSCGPDALEHVARRWWKQYLRNVREAY